jgi:hypothetical protein
VTALLERVRERLPYGAFADGFGPNVRWRRCATPDWRKAEGISRLYLTPEQVHDRIENCERCKGRGKVSYPRTRHYGDVPANRYEKPCPECESLRRLVEERVGA